MKSRPFCIVWSQLAVWLGVLVAGGSLSLAKPSLSADDVVQRVIAHSQRPTGTTSAPARFAYTKVTVTDHFDTSGKLKDHKERIYQISIDNGTTSAKLIEVNGHEPSQADLKKQTENQANARQVAGESRPRRNEDFLRPEVVARYDFSLVGQTNLNGRPTYVITFRPKRPSPPVHRMFDRVLDRVSGTVWVDAAEFEVAQAQMQLGSEVDVWGGVIGSLKKFAYTITRTRVADGLWLNTFSSGNFEGRKLFDSLHVKTQSRCLNFHPLA
jgi:hypothetical protein